MNRPTEPWPLLYTGPMRSPDPDRTYAPNPEVLVTDLGEELVLMHPASQGMFSLDAVGRWLWQALPATPQDLASGLGQAFTVEPEVALLDVQDWLADLLEGDLLRAQEPASAG